MPHEKEIIKHAFFPSSSTGSSSSESSVDAQPIHIKKRKRYYENKVENFIPKRQPNVYRQKRFVKRKGSNENPILVTDSESE